MSIQIQDDKIFNLSTKSSSYIIAVKDGKYLSSVYWGKKLRTPDIDNAMISGGACFDVGEPEGYSLNYIRQEYPTEHNGDYRIPAIKVEFQDGSRTCPLLFEKYEVKNGKPALEGLPGIYVEDESEAQCLYIYLKDDRSGLRVVLRYCVLENWDVITRAVKIINTGSEVIRLNKVSSASIDIEGHDMEFLELFGAWGRERHIERTRLRHGLQVIESRRGASSHQMNPFFALLSNNANETSGEVYGFNLIYSGNFHAGVEVDQLGISRAFIGLGDDDFSWLLEKNEAFVSPEAVLVYSDEGLGKMSRIFHRVYRKRLVRGKYRDETRPILVNNWEGTYFDFNEDKILAIATEASKIGIELMVLDDGWFGERNDDTTSLGDWFVNYKKLPNGIDGLAKKVNEKNMKFGLWFEPEMVSVKSELYKAHPDWCIHVENRARKETRNQLTLDLSRDDVCDYLIKTIGGVLVSAPIGYVKWDMNRHMSNLGSALLSSQRQRELPHRYMLGLYRVLETITKKHPNVLFESCSGGGGRFDPGILYYMPQTWTSDDTDPVERLYIQYGTSLVYPVSAMGAHVSASPNHQTHRHTSLKMRADVAMSGNFGYELDLSVLSDEEKLEMKNQVQTYKELRKFVPSANMYRLISPFENDNASWMFVSEDENDVFLAYFQINAGVNRELKRVKLQGLDEASDYEDVETGKVYHGDELMSVGLSVYLEGDAVSKTWIFRKKSFQ